MTMVSLVLSVGSLCAQRSMQRIDREIQKTVFIPKGTWMAGGTFSYSEHDETNLNFLVLKNVEGNGYDFTVSPYFGYFFRKCILWFIIVFRICRRKTQWREKSEN